MTWHASLTLAYRCAQQRTVCTRRHSGPLQVQKPLYPEGDDLCHSIVLHPPGGIAGGDRLNVDVAVEPQARALITTPGATRWYKANGRTAAQRIDLRVAGALEWLPQEAIVFDHADVRSEIAIDVAADAATIGWDIVALGRTASGEAFSDGCFAQSIRVHDDGTLQWVERTRVAGGDALLDSPIGLAGHPVFGCLWAIGPRWTDAQLDALRASLPIAAPITRLASRLLVARALGASTQIVRRALEAVWYALRPLAIGRAAITPRIWAT